MADYRLIAPSRSAVPSSARATATTISVGLEFYVNRPVYLKTVWYYRHRATTQVGTYPFRLYQVTGAETGKAIYGGTGTIPPTNGKNDGWTYGQANPILLQPNTRYLMVVIVDDLAGYLSNQYGSRHPNENGIGNSVIYAPGSKGALMGHQGSIQLGGSGFPTGSLQADDDFAIDITVTDNAQLSDPLRLSASGFYTRRTAAQATLALSASTVRITKRSQSQATAYLTLRASGRSTYSNSIQSVARLALSASGTLVRRTVIEAAPDPLHLSASGTAYKETELAAEAVLHLDAPPLPVFYAGVAENVRQALEGAWNVGGGYYQEAVEIDAESARADLMGGLAALAVDDRQRAREVLRHLRRFRVGHQSIDGGHYRNTETNLIGYKPYGDLGEQRRESPPLVIDQSLSWIAAIFKARFGEPIGTDVDSLLKWNDTSTIQTDKPLFGARFLSINRTISDDRNQIVSRPEIAVASWALLASSASRFMLPPARLPLPVLDEVLLSTAQNPDPHATSQEVTVWWSVVDGCFASAYQILLEYQVRLGEWFPFFEHTIDGQANRSTSNDGFARTVSVPMPTESIQLRCLVRMRNREYGEWYYSNIVPVFSTASTLYPEDALYPDEDLFPQG